MCTRLYQLKLRQDSLVMVAYNCEVLVLVLVLSIKHYLQCNVNFIIPVSVSHGLVQLYSIIGVCCEMGFRSICCTEIQLR